MARTAWEGGVTVMAATPHGRSTVSNFTRYSVPLLRERLAELRAALVAEGIGLEVVPGTEIFSEPGAVERLGAGELLPYGASRAVLVEFSIGVSRQSAEQAVFAFQLAGYRVVIAHPERYRFVQEDPNSLVALVERGALMQLTGDALVGHQGGRLHRLAELLLTHGLAHILATDAHGPHNGRLPNLHAARDRAARLVGAEMADLLTRGNPAAVLGDRPIAAASPRRVRRWSWL